MQIFANFTKIWNYRISFYSLWRQFFIAVLQTDIQADAFSLPCGQKKEFYTILEVNTAAIFPYKA